ncbi:hypothetical protein [Clostridium estertheticum]|uniref:hypothetical protein n=1 Tax=Clostridium estertheticum TaxID=238834 RepID=UPI001C0BCA10|nr:hypothetical protein [Clostridium estertheticum]MBU3186535.1 hypothetical protein [Clostridium estertheticum]
MKDPKCKYCGSEMDLGESEPNYEQWNCMNEECNATLTLDEKYDYDQWERDETEIGVTWQEAFEAGLEGKRIKVYGQNLTYNKFETLHFALKYLSTRPNYYKDLLKKEWYIEKISI